MPRRRGDAKGAAAPLAIAVSLETGYSSEPEGWPMRFVMGLIAVFAFSGVSARADDQAGKDKAPILSSEAKDHIGETRAVTLTVKHAKDGTHEESYFFDSESDYKDPKNLAIVIRYQDAEAFRKAGIANLVTHFDGKPIKVTGTIVKQGRQTRILVTEPKQIEVVEGKKVP
jgi:hypothetical protein